MDNLADLARTVTDFATNAAMVLLPAVPDYGPEVQLGPDLMKLPAFLDLAHKVGGGLLYLHAAPFNPEANPPEVDDPPTHLLQHTGKIGRTSVAFMANGLIHSWQQNTPWYQEWQDLEDKQPARRRFFSSLDQDDDEETLTDEEAARITTELVDTLLANPEFRAAKTGTRERVARLVISNDMPDGLSWRAIRTASDRAEELGRARYAELKERLDELAVEVVADPEYRQTSSAAARREVVAQFLIARAGGLSGPAYIRDELHRRAMDLRRAETSANRTPPRRTTHARLFDDEVFET